MLKNKIRKLPYLLLVIVLLLSQASSASAATQTISGDPIDIEVRDSGLIIPYFDNWASGYQYYSSGAKNSVLWLNNGAEGYDISDVVWSADCGTCTGFTPVSNSQPTPWTIVTVYDAGTTGIRITQTVSYINGAKYYNITWSIENTGSTTYSNLNWKHGGDTFFGGYDNAYGHYDAGLDMVYITNVAVTGIMGLLGTPTSPIDHYYEAGFSAVRSALSSGASLPDTVISTNLDAGYAVEWDRASLAPGDIWVISALEKWTTEGDVQVLAPAGQSGNVGDTFSYNFTVQNLQSSSDTFDLSTTSSEGWTVNLPGGSTVTIAAGGSEIVQVQVTATAAGVDLTTLTATSQADSNITNDGSVTTTATPPADTDNDGILDTIEGTGDRDGDGISNDLDYDPTGYFYDEATGEIISGGLVSVSGPGAVTTYQTGAAGYYQFTTDGTPGTYTLAVTLPAGYDWSDTCLQSDPPAYDPTGNPNPDVLGAGEDGTSGYLTSNACTSFYLTLDLAAGDPVIISNNLPLQERPLPDTGFAQGMVSQLPAQPAEKNYQMLGAMWLEVPKLSIRTPLIGVPAVNGEWDVTWLGNQAGYLMGSAFPTWSGNTVITGHVWNANNQPGIFVDLKKLQYGDQIRIHAWGDVYTYQVVENRRISPYTTNAVFEHKDSDWVTLFTCEDYGEYWGDYGYRRMVQAVLVDVRAAQ